MRLFSVITGSLTLVFLWCSAVVGAHAQNNLSEDTLSVMNEQMKEIIVQAFKQQQSLVVAPVSASAVTATAITNRKTESIKELGSFVPNLFMPDYGSKLTSPIFIRGIGSKINSPSVGLYVDGMPYFEKSAYDIDFNEVAKVEVLRGPQGTLYGRNTMGGIINVYTRSPLDYQCATAEVSVGSYGQQDYSIAHYRKIGDKNGISLQGNYHSGDGFFTNEYTGEKADDINSGAVRFRYVLRSSAKFSLDFTSNLDKLNQGGYPYGICDSVTLKPAMVNYDSYSYYRRTISTTGVTIRYNGEKFSLQNTAAFQYISDHQGIDQDFTTSKIYFAKQDTKQRMFSDEFNIKSTTGTRYKWIFGTFLFYQGIDNEVSMDYLSKGYSTIKWYDIPTWGVAVYHQSVFDDLFTKGLSFTVGLRYDYEHATNDYIYHRISDGNSQLVDKFNSKLKFSQLTPKFTLQYLFPSSGVVYASVAKGYKTGGFNTSFESEQERTFKPETSWNYEIGAKHPFLDKNFHAEISFFWIDWRNQQIYQMLSTQNGQLLRNAGRSESKGVELSMNGNPVNGLMVYLSYGYTDAKFKKYKDERRGLDYSGNRLPLVPEHTFAAGADYTISNPFRILDRITISANFTSTGRICWKEDNIAQQAPYRLLNGRISASKGIATIAVWAKNITDTDYNTYYFESGGNGLAQSGRPFTAGVDLQIKF